MTESPTPSPPQEDKRAVRLVIAAGIALPLLLVAAFALAVWIPRMNAPQPRYDFLFTAGQRPQTLARATLALEQSEGHVQAVYRAQNWNSNPPRLYRFHVETMSAEEIAYTVLPSEVLKARPWKWKDGLQTYEMELPEAAGFTLSADHAAPDGYVFETGGRRGSGGGIVGDIFFDSGSRRYGPALAGHGQRLPLPVSLPYEHYGYGDEHFLGWIIEEKSGESQ
jgi:hypothetical protein